MTTVKKPRAPRKPKVPPVTPAMEVPSVTPAMEVPPVTPVTPVKKTRAPRKPKVPSVTPTTPVAEEIENVSQQDDVASIDKFISELHTEKQTNTAKENGFFKIHKKGIYETLVVIVVIASAYLAGYYINSERVETPKEHVKF
jgi:hypothetical protein